MKVLSIGSDRKIFEEGSAVRARMVEYAGLFEELHIVVLNNRFKIQDLRFKNGKLQIADNCWVYPTNSWSRWFYVFGASRIGRKILERQSEIKVGDWIIDAQDPFECGLVATWIARCFNLPIHTQIHTDFLSPYFKSSSILNRIRVFIASSVLPKANGIRVVSQRIADSLHATRYTLHAVPTVLPIFTDLEKFMKNKPSFDLKQKYPQWSFIIVVVARLSSEKNVGFALSVLKNLLKVYPRTGLVIVGDGPKRARLKWQVWSSGLSKNVAFENWQSDLVPYYRGANLFLQTSLYEGFGLALLEAVTAGLPSVSTDVGIAPELLNHKGHSFVCPVNDLQCFTKAVTGLIENNQLRTFFSTQIAPSAVLPFTQSKLSYLEGYKLSIESALRAFPR